MLTILSVLIPVVLLVALGWFLGWRKIFDESVSNGLNLFLLNVSIPAIFFYATYKIDISNLLNPRFIAAYILLFFIVFIATYIIFRVGPKRSHVQSTLAANCSAVTNFGFVGLPILLLVIGRSILPSMAILMICYAAIILPCCIFMLEWDSQNQSASATAFNAFKKSIRHPFVIFTLLGILCSALHIKLPVFLVNFIQYVENTLTPCALIAVGLELSSAKLKELEEIAVFSIIMMIVRPILGFLIVFLFHLKPLYATIIILTFALPTGKTCFVLAKTYNHYVKESSGIISLTTLLSFITIPLSLIICYHLWPTTFVVRV
ncbi:MAG: AEC family transporter [Pseudomonadota bacterium]